jgi:hypothetical protein
MRAQVNAGKESKEKNEKRERASDGALAAHLLFGLLRYGPSALLASSLLVKIHLPKVLSLTTIAHKSLVGLTQA